MFVSFTCTGRVGSLPTGLRLGIAADGGRGESGDDHDGAGCDSVILLAIVIVQMAFCYDCVAWFLPAVDVYGGNEFVSVAYSDST